MVQKMYHYSRAHTQSINYILYIIIIYIIIIKILLYKRKRESIERERNPNGTKNAPLDRSNST